ncbi:MAG: bifunctional oligoribonuclease/PAP phosphatase NrnA [Candidatus Rokubacteria bacterium]|nr:bifunctional oligoribonuclease/PAP phosphatase NrnA [Candidatus Rokubacteria bacterium]
MGMPEQGWPIPRELIDLLSALRGSVLLLGHVQPDGDLLGSQIGLGLALRNAGAQVTLAGPQAVPDLFRFLPGAELVEQWEAAPGPFDLVILGDCPDPSRTHGLLAGARGVATRIVNIDHHPDNKRYGDVNWIEGESSATGEMVYDLIQALGLKVTPEIATNLFTAIHTDTGSFRYSNTTPRALRIAGDLVAQGAHPELVAGALYEGRKPDDLWRLGSLLGQVEVSPDGLVAWLALPHGSVPEAFVEAEDLVTYPRSIASVKVAVLLREAAAGRVKVSLRAKGEVNVGKIAAAFGGGGHANAAGCTIAGSLEEARAALLRSVSEALGKR